jgi:hypothetical protein
MLERLGEVLGWMGKGLAILTLLGTAFFIFVLNENDRFVHADTNMYWTVSVIGVVTAVVVFLIGQALRYILIGRK